MLKHCTVRLELQGRGTLNVTNGCQSV